MSALDWLVLAATLAAIVIYGMWRGRRHQHLEGYLLADRQMRWPTIALSIMATQASAITFLSTPGQAYTDGMRFLQFYLGLPIAMIILCAFFVPVFHRLKVFTAYEFLERRFGVKTRTITASLFLLQRGLSTGITIYAPALIISVILGWNIHITNVVIGTLVILYTTTGGTRAVSWTHVQQMLIILGGMATALVIAIRSIPADISVIEAVKVAGRMGRLNAIDFTFDFTTPYNFWGGMVGGLLVALSYFGADQSQVQRYLTGETLTESRLGLLFNGMVKVPMQFFILFTGAMVFVFYQFVAPPLVFNTVERAKIGASRYALDFDKLEVKHNEQFTQKRARVHALVDAMRSGDANSVTRATDELRAAQATEKATHAEAVELLKRNDKKADGTDTNYIFLTFVLRFLPAGVVGLVMAAIFCASMSSTASGLNSLASSSVIDIYKRHINPHATQHEYVRVSRWLTVGWGVFAIAFAEYVNRLGSLIEAVNRLGSLFYGTILAVFVLALFTKQLGEKPVIAGAILAEGATIYCWLFTKMAWLWWNVVGFAVAVVAALIIEKLMPTEVIEEEVEVV
ncbi:MAG TPA: sodium:solute symporter [Thermoanaerobaculia bacterium]|nr:sodium:solute symporter [Thermoanaerobaculia bacterium]